MRRELRLYELGCLVNGGETYRFFYFLGNHSVERAGLIYTIPTYINLHLHFRTFLLTEMLIKHQMHMKISNYFIFLNGMIHAAEHFSKCYSIFIQAPLTTRNFSVNTNLKRMARVLLNYTVELPK